MMNQKDGVRKCVFSELESNGIEFEQGMNVKECLNGSMKESIKRELVRGFKEGEIELKRDYDDDELRKYVGGLLNNWLRKDKLLNGGEDYKPKFKRGKVGDESVREMRKLLKLSHITPEQKEVVMLEIDKRLKENEVVIEVNVDKIPDHLKHLV